MDAEISTPTRHRVVFRQDLLDPADATLADAVASGDAAERVLAVFDRGLTQANPGLIGRVQAYFAQRLPRWRLAVDIIPGGEPCKNDPAVLAGVLAAARRERICRKSTILAVGGGAVLDVVGFAAATCHRGVRLVRIPTTTLAQADSAVGVKCGVNYGGVKNYLGAFAVPQSVLCDPTLLTTLSDRDWIAGFSEAVKVAILKDERFFSELEQAAGEIRERRLLTAMVAVHRSAELHFRHIVEGGDPFEHGRARPLDFGHWAAHRLEELTDFALPHGHAVAIGVALDSVYAARVGLWPAALAGRVVGCLQRLGFELGHRLLADPDGLLPGIEAFREHLGGRLALTMPTALGAATEIHEVDESAMRAAMRDMIDGAVSPAK